MTADRLPVPRRMDFQFDPDAVPRWWFKDNPVATHVSNGLHLVFPEGERFFIRSVKHYLDKVQDDPQLVSRIRAFFQQESEHGREHGHSFELLEAQGFEVKPFLEQYERHLRWLEETGSPVLRLSTTAALEHLTASLGETALTEDFLDAAHPTFRDLLRWHAAEEIEHKSVAYDVFERVSGSYVVRVLGMAIGLLGLLFFWGRGARMLMAQEGLSWSERRRHRKALLKWRGNHTRKLLWQAVTDYLRPGFHPDENDNYHLAEAYLGRLGRLAG